MKNRKRFAKVGAGNLIFPAITLSCFLIFIVDLFTFPKRLLCND